MTDKNRTQTDMDNKKDSKSDVKSSDKSNLGITVKKLDDMPEWYSQVVIKAEVADYSPVRGCIVIRPYGYAIWQGITDYFNSLIKEKGVQNAYFPLFIPESFFKREQEHAEGFSPEVAWLENKDENTERLAVRPTSETIMYDMYSRWIRSWRDLPLRINQWCNVVRWEVKDVKPFIRSREFLWQEGHCVYETEEECVRETKEYLEMYRKVSEELLAIPVILGRKSEKEKFAGAKNTFSIEGFMPDGKALQMGTSHNLGQNFAKAFNIKFLGKDKVEHLPWQNSWGISTRMIGALIMMHGDDQGLILPPKIAPIQAVIVPILFDATKEKVIAECNNVKRALEAAGIRVKLDDREEYSSGWKYNEWEMKGVPLRIEIGPKDLEKGCVMLVRRDNKKKESIPNIEVVNKVNITLESVQQDLFTKAKNFFTDNLVTVTSWDEFAKVIDQRKIARAFHCGEIECEDMIKEKTTGATSRNIPFNDHESSNGKCVHCGKPAKYMIYFSKNY